jgi:hypothetical protein
MADDLLAEWNRNFNQEPFAKVFPTPHGQYLAYEDYDDEGARYVIRVVGAPVRGVVPKATLGYDSEEERGEAFVKIDQALADETAKALFQAADKCAPNEA